MPGEQLQVTVGEAGVDRVCTTGEGPSVGTLGGGARGGVSGSWLAGSAGGGATSLRRLSFGSEPEGPYILVVAGGGGGAAENSSSANSFGGDAGQAGGNAGGANGGGGGQPGDLGAGGAGGTGSPNCIGGGMGDSGAPGVLGAGGRGGDFISVGAGGGGGGGFYGGGGGGGGCRGGGGGGGSSFAAPDGTVLEPAAPSEEGARLSISYLAPSATATIASAPVPFPVVAQGTVSAPQPVEIANTGEAPLVVGGASFAGSHPGDFMIGSSTCGSPIEPGQSCRMQVRFVPQAQGPRSATLSISSDDPAGPVQVALSGTGGQLPAGAAGAAGPRGPAGRVALITCKSRRAARRAPKRCTTKLGNTAIKFAFRGARTAAVLSRGSTVYAKGFAVRSLGRRGMQLVMTPLRTLGPGRYKLRLGRARGSRPQTILIAPPKRSSAGRRAPAGS